jgi:hypothetical protein
MLDTKTKNENRINAWKYMKPLFCFHEPIHIVKDDIKDVFHYLKETGGTLYTFGNMYTTTKNDLNLRSKFADGVRVVFIQPSLENLRGYELLSGDVVLAEIIGRYNNRTVKSVYKEYLDVIHQHKKREEFPLFLSLCEKNGYK